MTKQPLRIILKHLTISLTLGFQLAGFSTQAAIPRATDSNIGHGIDFSLVTNYSVFDSRNQLSSVPRVLARETLSADEMTLQVPPSIQEASNWQNTRTFEQTQATSQVNSAIARNLLNTNVNRILQDEKQNGGAIAGAADRIQNTMQTNVSFGGSDPSAVHHSVKVKLSATQGQAIMNYSGWLDAQLSYSVGSNSEMRAAITQKLDSSTNLVVENTNNRVERIQRVSVSFNF